MPEVNFSVKAESKSHTKTVVKSRGMEMVVDEPENLKGTNDGPNPVEYILAGLSGCLNVVGHLVAQEMGFEIGNMEIEIEGPLDPAKFMGQKEEARAGYKNINVDINVETDADSETLAQWIEEVEERCPVSDNLSNQTPLNISVN